MTLPTDPQGRKAIPIYSGFIKYFPRAICAVAELSRIGNDQHNPGQPLHWDRSKSGDEKDALMRHLIDQTIEGDNATDTDQVLHATKKAWRAMADLEKILERKAEKTENNGSWRPWNGGECPDNGLVQVRFRNGEFMQGVGQSIDWQNENDEADVVMWRPA